MSRGTEKRSAANMVDMVRKFLRPTTLQEEHDMDGWNAYTHPGGGKPGKRMTSGMRGAGQAKSGNPE